MWWEVSISAPSRFKDDLFEILFDEQTNGILEGKKDLVPEGTISLQAYFESENFPNLFEKIKVRINKLAPKNKKKTKSITITSKQIIEKNWGCSWAKHFKPVNVGKMIVISPPWIKDSGKSKRKNISIYPGMAFGTGTHESTRLCLKMIEYVVLSKEKNIRDSFLDIGTGSGILSISAYKLGFKKCRGIDIDEDALRNARHNLRLNGIKKGINFTKVSPEQMRKIRYSFVASNMILNRLASVSTSFPTLVKTGGLLAISGILKGQDIDFLKLESIRGFFKKEKKLCEGEWCGLLLRRI